MRTLTKIEMELVAGGWASDDGEFVDISGGGPGMDPYAQASWMNRLMDFHAEARAAQEAARNMLSSQQQSNQSYNNLIDSIGQCIVETDPNTGNFQFTSLTVTDVYTQVFNLSYHSVFDYGASGRPEGVWANSLEAVNSLARLGAESGLQFFESDGQWVTSRNVTDSEANQIRLYTSLTLDQAKQINIHYTDSLGNIPAKTFGNDIYINSNMYSPSGDMSSQAALMALLNHEAQHVYQYSAYGAAYVSDGVFHAMQNNWAGYYYGNMINNGASFKDLNTEQQSSIIQDLYRLDHGLPAINYIQGNAGAQPNAETLRNIVREGITEGSGNSN